MEVFKLFPIEFFRFTNEQIPNSKIVDYIHSLDAKPKISSNLSYQIPLHKNQELSELFDWFTLCLEQIRITQKYDCDKFSISSSWYNQSLKNQGMHQTYHKHTNSFFSGIYYLSEGSPTVFEDPVIPRCMTQLEVLRKDYSPFERTMAIPGSLIIFPSYVFHHSPPHVENFDRHVISFNVLPTGKINSSADADASIILGVE
jgi:hypothetical protein